MNRLFIIAVLLLSTFAVMADKKMTIQNADTGESFEVMVPDGLRIYEYNGNWLDSIPYLVEHARYGEPWAYEALAECHRHGKGGVKRSFLNTLFYYELAGKDIESSLKEIEQSNHDDPVAIFARVINYLESDEIEHALCAIDTLHNFDYHSADILSKYIRKEGKTELEDVLKYATDPATDPDASVFAIVGYALSNKNDSTKVDISWSRSLLMDKIPFMYSYVGRNKYRDTIKSETPDGYAENAPEKDVEDRRKAVEYFLKADEYGALTKDAARLLNHYLTYDSTSNWVNLSEEDMYRIQLIADIEE